MTFEQHCAEFAAFSNAELEALEDTYCDDFDDDDADLDDSPGCLDDDAIADIEADFADDTDNPDILS